MGKKRELEWLLTKVVGLRMVSPVLTASGTFGYGMEYPKLRDFPIEVLGGIVLKSVTLNPRLGNPEPRFVETSAGLINSVGLQNVGIDKLISRELPKVRKYKTNIIVSMAGYTLDEYQIVSEKLNKSDDYDAVEVNISCPNVKKEGMLFSFDPKAAATVTNVVKENIKNKPIIMKLSPNAPDIAATALACANAGADAISLVNTFTALAIDVKSQKPFLKRNFGGLSGPAIKPIALALVAKVAEAFRTHNIQIPIIGIGGIQTAEDVLEYMIAGASSVQVGTSIFWNPMVIGDIVDGLIKFCKETNRSINDIVGSLKMNHDFE